MQLVINELIQDNRESNKMKRVVWVDSKRQLYFLVEVKNPSTPQIADVSQVDALLETEDLIKMTTDPWANAVKEDNLTRAEKERRNKAWEIIQKIYRAPDIFHPKKRAGLVKTASEEFGVSAKTVRLYLTRYWARGMTKNALLPDYLNCGKQIKKERHYDKKPGRPNVYPSSLQRAPVNEDWKKIIRTSLEKFYFIRSKPSLRHAYNQMLKEWFTTQDKDSGYKVLATDEPIISYDQFYYWFRKWYKPEDAIHKREGRREFLQKYRSITGSATEDAMGIGTYAIDATIGDIYLVSSLDRTTVIGRPIIYLSVDIFSRAITGIGVGIENMSGHSLRMALAMTFGNKSDYCKKVLHLDIEETAWPIHHIPHTILADRGSELISDDLTQVVENLNIKLQNTGSYRPELKAICEKYFDIVQQHISPFLPGAVQKDFMKRGGVDYRKKAVLNLHEYSRILIHCVLYYNNHNFLVDYPLTKEMIESQIRPIPIEIFEWGLQSGAGQLRKLSNAAIHSNVYPRSQARVTPKGIHFNDLYYSCQLALKEKWFSKARIQGTWMIEVMYDPQSLATLYIRIDRQTFELCTLIDQYEMYQHASLAELDQLKQAKRHQQADYQEENINGTIKLAQEIESIVKQAKSEAKLSGSGTEKDIKNIRENRVREKAVIKGRKVEIHEKKKDNNRRNDVGKNTASNDVLNLFRKKQQEVWNDGDD